MKKAELLAPAGDMGKLETALHFGADAAYFAGKKFGLRAFAGNFDEGEMQKAFELLRKEGKKGYVALNIFASNADFGELRDYVRFLRDIGADGIIASDPGVISFVKNLCPDLDIHLSTQANTTNKYSVSFWRDMGVKRVVLARELSLDDIKEIKDFVGNSVELEAFVHGAMCISYSGRCLLSSYLTDRDSNRGECVQACRWEYAITEKSRLDSGSPLTVQEDARGTYILNSKDMNTISVLDKIVDAGVSSLKIEGRMKSEYYVGCVVNAYRKRLDGIYAGKPYDSYWEEELKKVNHREYTTGFYFGRAEQCYETSKPDNPYSFVALVKGYDEERGLLEIEMRNRFKKGDLLEAVSVTDARTVKADRIFDSDGKEVVDCKIVQQRLFIETDVKLEKNDMLRIANGGKNVK